MRLQIDTLHHSHAACDKWHCHLEPLEAQLSVSRMHNQLGINTEALHVCYMVRASKKPQTRTTLSEHRNQR